MVEANNCYVSIGEINGEKKGLGGLVGIVNSTNSARNF